MTSVSAGHIMLSELMGRVKLRVGVSLSDATVARNKLECLL